MNVVLIVEGFSELGLKDFFLPHLTIASAKDDIINFKGSGNLFNDFHLEARKTLSSDPQVYVLCLVDFDVAQKKYPYPKRDYSPEEHVAYIRERMEAMVDETWRKRFKCFPVVYEIETWMLADEIGLEKRLRSTPIHHPKPPESYISPKSRLDDLFWEFKKRDYDEIVDGQHLLKQEGKRQRIVDGQDCPFFQTLWEEIIIWDTDTPSFSIQDKRLHRLADLQIQLTTCNRTIQNLLQHFNDWVLDSSFDLDELKLEELQQQETKLVNQRGILKAEIAKLEALIALDDTFPS